MPIRKLPADENGWIHWRDQLPEPEEKILIERRDYSVEETVFNADAGEFRKWKPI